MSGAYNLKEESTIGDRSFSQSVMESIQMQPLPTQATIQKSFNVADGSAAAVLHCAQKSNSGDQRISIGSLEEEEGKAQNVE